VQFVKIRSIIILWQFTIKRFKLKKHWIRIWYRSFHRTWH